MSGLANELLKMCSDVCFDMYAAEKIIQRVELNQEIIDTQRPNSRTSYLSVATQSANVEMVRLLLQKGANPNFVLYGDKPLWRENPFWDLQYCLFGESAEDSEVGLQMAQIMLDYGANPAIVLEEEDLFSYVYFAVFNNDDTLEQWEYRSRFFILLIAYGGFCNYCTPKIVKEFDKTNMGQYRFRFVACSDGYQITGEIVDYNDEVVAEL